MISQNGCLDCVACTCTCMVLTCNEFILCDVFIPQIPQSMTDSQYCSLNALETHVKECFQKASPAVTVGMINATCTVFNHNFSCTHTHMHTHTHIQYATGIHLHPIGYLAWTQGEPLPIAWLPILHRMTAAETSECVTSKERTACMTRSTVFILANSGAQCHMCFLQGLSNCWLPLQVLAMFQS